MKMEDDDDNVYTTNNYFVHRCRWMLGFLVYMLIGLILPSIILHPMKRKQQQQQQRYNNRHQKMKSIIQLQQELEDCAMELEQESLGNTQQTSIMESTTAAICAIQKNGLYYIDEWVDYHLAIGFSTIYIYDNSDENELLQWSMGRNPNQIQVIHWPGSKQQKVAYKHCSIAQKQKQPSQNHHRWLAMIDIDEFIVLDYNRYNSILDLLEDFVPEDKAGLVLNRVNFYFSYNLNHNNRSSSSLLNLDDGNENNNNNTSNEYEEIIYRPVLQRFQHRLNWEDWYKTIAKTDWIVLPNVHGHSYSRRRHSGGGGAVDILGNNVTQIPLPHPQGINGTPAIIYHYQTYSLKEFQSKCQRGDAAWGKYYAVDTTTTTATTSSSPTNDSIYNETNTNTNTTNTTTKRPSIIGNQESCLPSEEIQNRFYSRRKGAIPGIFDDRPWKFLQKNVPVYRKYTTKTRRRNNML